jgi:hypothetical protein
VEHEAAKEISTLVSFSYTPLFVFVCILINQVPQHDRASSAVSQYSRATRIIMIKIHLVSTKALLAFPKSLKVHSDYMPRTTKILKAAMLDRTDKHKDKSEQEMTMFGLCETFIHLGSIVNWE